MGSRRVRHDWATSLSLFTFMHWRRKWQPTPVFLPGESQGQGTCWAAFYGVAQSQTRLKWLSSSSSSKEKKERKYTIRKNTILKHGQDSSKNKWLNCKWTRFQFFEKERMIEGLFAQLVQWKSESETLSVMSDPLRPHGLYSPWNSPGQNPGVGSLSLLQGIFPTQGSNPGLPHCRQILCQLSHKGSPLSSLESVFILPPETNKKKQNQT